MPLKVLGGLFHVALLVFEMWVQPYHRPAPSLSPHIPLGRRGRKAGGVTANIRHRERRARTHTEAWHSALQCKRQRMHSVHVVAERAPDISHFQRKS